MNTELLVNTLQTSGRVSGEQVSRWTDAAGLMAALDAIGRDGANAVVKIDGARPDGAVYTIVISGAQLGEAFFRKDGSDLLALLRDAIEFYRSVAWTEQSQ
ncbi:MAG: hypothetical protein QM739_08415 [Propionivibrio sp.]